MIINREHMIEKQEIKFLSKIFFRKKMFIKELFLFAFTAMGIPGNVN